VFEYLACTSAGVRTPDVVVTGLQQRALEVVRFRKGNPAEVTTAQHLALALDVESASSWPTRSRYCAAPTGSQIRWSKERPSITRRPTATVATPSRVTTTGTSCTAPTESTATSG